jgi:hypothetical protein
MWRGERVKQTSRKVTSRREEYRNVRRYAGLFSWGAAGAVAFGGACKARRRPPPASRRGAWAEVLLGLKRSCRDGLRVPPVATGLACSMRSAVTDGAWVLQDRAPRRVPRWTQRARATRPQQNSGLLFSEKLIPRAGAGVSPPDRWTRQGGRFLLQRAYPRAQSVPTDIAGTPTLSVAS